MLSLLHIENIAIIQTADISFDSGFNVLTGETGAGKSIVIDAISAVLGERTSRELIRTGSKSALVTAVFTDEENCKWLADNGIPSNGKELLVQREILGDGRNICQVNGRIVTTAQLRELGRSLLNIHGQRDGQQLLLPSAHLDFLDSFGKTSQMLQEYQLTYGSMCKIQKQISDLRMDEAERSRKVDNLHYQIAELERAELKPGEDYELDKKKNLLRNAGKLMESVEAVGYALSGGEDTQGACGLLAEAVEAARTGARKCPQLSDLSEKLESLYLEADSLNNILYDLKRDVEFSPEELDQMEARLDLLYRLKKKYGNTVDEMLSYLEHCRAELDRIQYSDDTIRRLESELGNVKDEALKQAKMLSSARHKAAKSLQTRVQEELRQLDMPKVRFETEFSTVSGEDGIDGTGMDEVQFLMSANLGEDLKPIQKVASGGEMARIMLALKNVLAEDDGVSSLIFDEVDSGISGRAAQKVAEKMADVARYKQVLCVTHLPQLAAMADTHFSVEKGEQNGRTYTKVERLNRAGRVEELARLIGGTEVTDVLRESAEELLCQAERYRASIKP